jgi:hypothetical protein
MRPAHKHAGSRRFTRRSSAPQHAGLLLAGAVTAAVVAWGYLISVAIDFGTSARGGESRAWWYLAMASLGAVLCLFLGLILISRLLHTLGITTPAENREETSAPRPPGGRRAAR